jgi:hypothetical protein
VDEAGCVDGPGSLEAMVCPRFLPTQSSNPMEGSSSWSEHQSIRRSELAGWPELDGRAADSPDAANGPAEVPLYGAVDSRSWHAILEEPISVSSAV